MRKILLLSLMVTLFASCKVNYQLVNDVLKVEEAFIQEEIPGQKGMQKKEYLNIYFKEELNNVTIDSIRVHYNGYSTVRNVQFDSPIKSRNEIRMNQQLFVDDGSSLSLSIYFHQGKKNFRQVVAPLLVKEPIYLP